jgi:uncharacterized membrane protein YkoI
MTKRFEKTMLGILAVLILGIGSVLVAANFGSHDEDYSDSKDQKALEAYAKISKADAMAIAIDLVDASKVGEMTEVELEMENGIVVYGVEFTKDGLETDVKIDAATGKIVSMEDDLTDGWEDDVEGEEE